MHKKKRGAVKKQNIGLDKVLVPPQGILQGTKDPTVDGDCSHEIK